MKKIFFCTCIVFLLPRNFQAQCPEIRFIMVDACNGAGSERDNEFFVLHSGSGFSVNDLGFTTPTGSVTATSSDHHDFFTTNPCPACLTGCTIHFVTNGESVPADQHVMIFTSRNFNYMTYDISGLCLHGEIFVLVANAAPGTGQFANYSPAACSGCQASSGNPDRTTSVTLSDGCSSVATYNRCQLRNLAGNCGAQDGGSVVFENGAPYYNNNGCSSPSLPVEWHSFDAEKHVQGILLTWQTASEVNNDYFAILRSSDGQRFEEIARVDGSGFSDSLTSYVYLDKTFLSGTVYYQLRQTDFDGKTTLSEVRMFRGSRSATDYNILITPHMVQISGHDHPFNLTVFSASGIQVAGYNQLPGYFECTAGIFPSGVYLFVLENDFGYQVYKVVL